MWFFFPSRQYKCYLRVFHQSCFLHEFHAKCPERTSHFVVLKNRGTNSSDQKNVYDGALVVPSAPLSRSDNSSWNSSLKMASRLCFSSCCSFNIPRFSSALMTWFSLRIRTAFMRRCREPLIT